MSKSTSSSFNPAIIVAREPPGLTLSNVESSLSIAFILFSLWDLEVVAVDLENNVILIKGNVPGPKQGLVIIKSAVKANGKINAVEDLVVYEEPTIEVKETEVNEEPSETEVNEEPVVETEEAPEVEEATKEEN